LSWCRPTFYAYMLNFILIGLFCDTGMAETPKFCHFLDFGILWCRHLAVYGESWMWVHNYKPFPIQQYQNLFLYSNAFKVKSCTHVSSFRSVTDKQWNPSSIKLGMLTEDLKHVLSLPKHLGVGRIFSLLVSHQFRTLSKMLPKTDVFASCKKIWEGFPKTKMCLSENHLCTYIPNNSLDLHWWVSQC